MAKPGRATQGKRNRELAKQDKRKEKEDRRTQRKEQKTQPSDSPFSSDEDPDLAGIVPGPQKPWDWDETH